MVINNILARAVNSVGSDTSQILNLVTIQDKCATSPDISRILGDKARFYIFLQISVFIKCSW